MQLKQHNWILNSVLQEATIWHRHIKQPLSYLSSLIYTLNCVRHRNALIFRFLAVYNSRVVQIPFHVWKSFIENGHSQLKVLFFSRSQRSVLVRCQQLPKVWCDKLVRQRGAKVYHSFLRGLLKSFMTSFLLHAQSRSGAWILGVIHKPAATRELHFPTCKLHFWCS